MFLLCIAEGVKPGRALPRQEAWESIHCQIGSLLLFTHEAARRVLGLKAGLRVAHHNKFGPML